MAERRVYHVTPHDDGWQVEMEDAQRASNVYDNKEEAVDRARELAQSASLGQVIVHKEDGTIQTEYTYGDDPHPPQG